MYRFKRKVILETAIYRAFQIMVSNHGDQIVSLFLNWLPPFVSGLISVSNLPGDLRVGHLYLTNLNCEMEMILNLFIKLFMSTDGNKEVLLNNIY